MSKKTRYFIEPTDNGKVQCYIIKNNKNKKFLTEHPEVKEVSKTEYDKSVNIFTKLKDIKQTHADKTNTI